MSHERQRLLDVVREARMSAYVQITRYEIVTQQHSNALKEAAQVLRDADVIENSIVNNPELFREE